MTVDNQGPSPADRVADALRSAGVSTLYGVPGGGSNLDVIGAFERAGGRFVLVHGETAAAIMAGMHGELTGYPGACLVTRGPGLASAVNGLAQAMLDGQPMVVISDCVSASDRARVSHQRLDQSALVSEVCVASFTVGGPSAGFASDRFAARAVGRALSGRPGPVHIDIDATAESVCHFDSQNRDDRARADSTVATGSGGRPGGAGYAALLLEHAQAPVVVIGVGAVAVGAEKRAAVKSSIDAFVERHRATVLTTYKARGMVADSSHLFGGVMTGATIEHDVLASADAIVGIGLDPVELIPGEWPYAAPVVLLGQWPEGDSRYFGDRVAFEDGNDLVAALDGFAASAPQARGPVERVPYGQRAIAEVLRSRHSADDAIAPHDVVVVARAEAPPGTIATVDAGAHMLAAMTLWSVDQPYELLISSGLATMGFSLPAAVAAAVVHPDRRVVCFIGDGGLGMVLAELETVARLGLKVTVVVFNDAALSLIAVKQGPGQGGTGAVAYNRSDFASIAKAVGLDAFRADDVEDLRNALRTAFTSGPTLIDVRVDPISYPALLRAIRGKRP